MKTNYPPANAHTDIGDYIAIGTVLVIGAIVFASMIAIIFHI